MSNNKSLLTIWEAAQPFLSEGAKDNLDNLNEQDATDCVKAFFIDQTMSARDVLTENTWKPAAGIVAYLFSKHPSIIPSIKEWYNKIAKKGAMNFQAETGSWVGYDKFYFGE